LDEGEVAGVGDCGCADDGQRGGFGGDDGESEGPPRGGFAAEEVVEGDGAAIALAGNDGFFSAPEAHAKRGYGQEVGDDDGQVEWVNAHLRLKEKRG
jgi:hypothetical protein